MRLTSKGQVSIPQAVRDKAGLQPHSGVEFEVCANGDVLIRRMVSPFDLDAALQKVSIKREAQPWDAAYLAGQAFKIYHGAKGDKQEFLKRSPMPDFYIGAHALVGNMRLLTRDAVRFQTYFPKLSIISP